MNSDNIFFETINQDKLKYIIDNFQSFKGKIRDSCFADVDYDPLTMLKNVLNSCDEKGILKVQYHQKKGKGRMMADLSISFQGMIREVRHTLAKGIYVDIDMCNAHPVILSYLARINNFNCEHLDEYINNREKYLKPIGNRELGKKLYLALTNGGTADYNKLSEELKTEHLKGYRDEMICLHNSFAKLYPDEYITYCRAKKEKRNFKAGFMNTLLCDMENKLLQIVRKTLAPKCDNLVLCFDGIMLPMGKYNLLKCEKAFNKKFKGINMKLAIKEFDEALNIPDNIPKFIREVRYNGFLFDDNIILPSQKQLKVFRLLLDELPLFFKDYYSIRKLIFGSKSWYNCKPVADILTEVIKEKSDIDIDIAKAWNYISCGVKPYTIYSLLYEHDKNTEKIKQKLEKKHYYLFQKQLHINPLESYEKLDIDIKQINQKYITHQDGKPNLTDFSIKNMKNKITVIRSHTGSGKTEFLRWIGSQFNEHVFISVAIRVVLAEYHSSILNTRFYKGEGVKLHRSESWDRDSKYNGMSCVIDSLVRIKINPNRKYILFLDEISSLLDYISNKDSLKKRRRDIINILMYLIVKADYVFCVDADINTQTLQFLKNVSGLHNKVFELKPSFFITKNEFIDEEELYNRDDDYEDDTNGFTKKDIIMFNNNFKTKRCDVVEFSDMSEMMKIIIKDIENDETLFICSDSNIDFYNKVFQPVIVYLKKQYKKSKSKTGKRIIRNIKKGRFSYYSADEGNKDDFKNSKALNNKIVFVSPVITTGLDLNYSAKVYGFYFGCHLTAPTIIQQLGRIRQPIVINLYFRQVVYRNHYDVFDNLINDYEKAKGDIRDFIKPRKDITIDEIEGAFHNYNFFINEKYRNVRFHTLDILKNKGESIIYNNNVDVEELMKDLKITLKIRTVDAETLAKRYLYICDEIDGLEKKKRKILDKIVGDNQYFNSYINFRKTVHNTKADLLHEISRTDDLEVHQLNQRATKILLLKRFMKKIKVDFDGVNYSKDYKNLSSSKKTFTVKDMYFKAFRFNKKAYPKVFSELQARELVLNMINNLMPSYVSLGYSYFDKKQKKVKLFNYDQGLKEVDMFISK
jgi:hypothetical protein